VAGLQGADPEAPTALEFAASALRPSQSAERVTAAELLDRVPDSDESGIQAPEAIETCPWHEFDAVWVAALAEALSVNEKNGDAVRIALAARRRYRDRLSMLYTPELGPPPEQIGGHAGGSLNDEQWASVILEEARRTGSAIPARIVGDRGSAGRAVEVLRRLHSDVLVFTRTAGQGRPLCVSWAGPK
jgi:hypothetical protein